MKWKKHDQTKFVDYFGNTVEVDKNLLGTLEALRDFGVRTEFSCEGREDMSAYFLANLRSIWPLFKMIYGFYKAELYSKSSQQLVRSFLRGVKEICIWLFPRSNNRAHFVFGTKSRKGSDGYELEFTFSTKDWFRFCVRWPYLETPRVFALLQETWRIRDREKNRGYNEPQPERNPNDLR